MFTKDFFKRYLLRGFIAAAVYCVTVVIFLYNETFQSIWVLFLGCALYMCSIAAIIYFSNREHKFTDSPVTSAISGHVLSFTGAALTVILSLVLYLIFNISASAEHTTEALQHTPAGMPHNTTHGILFVLIVVAALGNTITGFFAALFTSFGSSKQRTNEQAS
ncbi:MAG: hypothetical protein M3R72_01700 [Bacteroidota bacterium]|nr:hypothetical protein [Bacteroidota bacterium]